MTTFNELIAPMPYNVFSTTTYNQFVPPSLSYDIKDFDKAFDELQEAWKKYGDIIQTTGTEFWNFLNNNTVDIFGLFKLFLNFGLSFIPEAAFAVPFINQILGLAWPALFGKAKPSAKDLFEDLKPQIEALINQKLTEDQTNFLATVASGIQAAMTTYTQALDTYNKEPSSDHRTELRSAINTVMAYSNGQKELMKQKGYELLGAPHIAHITTLQVVLYRDIIKNADAWQYTQVEKDQTVKEMRKLILTNTEWLRTVYKNEIVKYPNYQTDKEHFNKYFKLTGQMRATCFDFAVVWTTLDPYLYPVNIGANIECTRVVTSGLLDTSGEPTTLNPQVMSDIYDQVLTFGKLKTIGFQTALTADTVGYFAGQTQTRELPNGTKTFSKGTTPQRILNISNDNPIIDSIYTRSELYHGLSQGISYTFKDGSHNGFSATGAGATTNTTTAPGPIPSGDGLSGVYAFNRESNIINQYFQGSTQIDTPVANILGGVDPDTQKPIVQVKSFPFDKIAHIGDTKFEIEATTGAYVAEIYKTQFSYTLPITVVEGGQYAVRIRYGAVNDGSICQINVTNTEMQFISKTISLPVTEDFNPGTNDDNLLRNPYVQGEHAKYSYYTITPEVAFSPGQTSITINASSNNTCSIFLDRIEFVPVPVPDPTPVPTQQVPSKSISCGTGDSVVWSAPANQYASRVQFNPSNVDITLSFKGVRQGKPDSSGHFSGHFDQITASCPELSESKSFNGATINPANQNPPCNNYPFYISFDTLTDLEQITKQVHGLFTSSSYTALTTATSDYLLDQITMKVNALSNEAFGVEKQALRQLLNKAKQFSKSRNLLVGGDFETNHGWLLGHDVTRIDSPTGDYLFLPPPTMYPSYAYQKIDESKLKANTRYTISGFIRYSDGLEIVVSRYGEEIQKTLHVPYEELLPLSSDDTVTCCQASSCPPCPGGTRDSHFFQYNIDVGTLDPARNPGIQVGFRIMKPNGFAKISHIEVQEERPLTDKEIQKVQRQTAHWNKVWTVRLRTLQQQVQPVIDAINALYQNEDWNGMVRPNITYQDVTSIVIPTLEGYSPLQQKLQQAVIRAYEQVAARNLIHSGNFVNPMIDSTTNGNTIGNFTNQMMDYTTNWDTIGDLSSEPNNLGLRFQNQYTSMTQTVALTDWNLDKEYMLAVSAQGKGTITIQQEGYMLETMCFSSDTPITKTQGPFFSDDKRINITVQADNTNFFLQSIVVTEVPGTSDASNPSFDTMGPFGQL